jgi:oligoribonuclease NrnB/cAMP/cGMP phosphodiesterase (DHH superfamily)
MLRNFIKMNKKRLQPKDIDIVVYHHPCTDGFTSATIANTFFKNIKKPINYMGMNYNNPPDQLYQTAANKNLLICDFSFKKPVTDQLIKVCKDLLIIDHHVSAQKELEHLDDKYKIFDMEHCGAYLTWEYFYPEQKVPLFVKYVEDNDIWTKKMPFTEEVTSYVSTLDLEFDQYERFIVDENLINTEIIPRGKVLFEQKRLQIQHNLTNSIVKMVEYDGKVYFVGLCNTMNHINETGHQLLAEYPYLNFSSIYFNTEKGFKCSFRSENNKTNVSELATMFGGGGHRNAAGCYLSNPFPGVEIGNIDNYHQLNWTNFRFNMQLPFSDDKKKYNYIALSTGKNKCEFAKFLLQDKYQNENNKSIQEGSEIYRIRVKSDKSKLYDDKYYPDFNFAITWHLEKKKMWIVMHYTPNTECDIEKQFKQYNNFEWNKEQRLVKFSINKFNIMPKQSGTRRQRE